MAAPGTPNAWVTPSFSITSTAAIAAFIRAMSSSVDPGARSPRRDAPRKTSPANFEYSVREWAHGPSPTRGPPCAAEARSHGSDSSPQALHSRRRPRLVQQGRRGPGNRAALRHQAGGAAGEAAPGATALPVHARGDTDRDRRAVLREVQADPPPRRGGGQRGHPAP